MWVQWTEFDAQNDPESFPDQPGWQLLEPGEGVQNGRKGDGREDGPSMVPRADVGISKL